MWPVFEKTPAFFMRRFVQVFNYFLLDNAPL